VTRSVPAAPKDFFYQRGRGTGAGSASDQQVRLVIRYGGLLDLALLRRAVAAVAEDEPILRARLVEPRPWEGRWEVRDEPDALPEVELAEAAAAPAAPEVAAFLADLTVRDDGPYVRLRVVRAGGRDTLCLRVDHRLTDGGGTRLLAYRLSAAYRQLAAGEPLPPPRGDLLPRTVAGITGREPPTAPPPPPPPSRPLSFALPRTGYANERPGHAVRVIDAPTVAAVRRAGKVLGATLTDALLAALVPALRPHRLGAPGEPLTLMVSSDYRNRLPPGTPDVLCNLFQGFFPALRDDPARPFRAALAEAAEAMGRCRAGFTLEDALRTEAATAVPARQYANLGAHPTSPPEREATFVLLSNVGVLDPERLALGAGPSAPPVLDAQLLGTVALARELLVCASSFRGALTLSIGSCASDLDPAVPAGILDRLAAALTAFAAEG
jgi:NRPS condensation-like uncharacterized protein